MMEETQNLQNTAPSPVGQALKSGREAAGLTVAEIGEKLKLSARQIEALENDDFAALPGNTFVRGFVRNYARLVSLDPQPLLEQLSVLLPQERVQAAMPKVGEATALNVIIKTRSQGPSWQVWLMAALGLLLGTGVVFWYLQQQPAPMVTLPAASVPAVVPASAPAVMISEIASAPEAASSVASAVPASQVASRPAAASSPMASRPVAQVASAAGAGMIRLVTEYDSWVQIRDADGQVLVSQVMGQGAERVLSGRPPFQIKIGNAPKTKLYYHGQPVDLAPHSRADVATLELK